MTEAVSGVETTTPAAEIEHIGLLVVHGIGDQSRTEHLQSVAADITRIMSIQYGKKRVNAQMFPGIQRRGDISIVLKINDNRYQAIHLNEVWWRDLGQKNTPSNIARFWLWAATFSGTGGRFAERNSDNFPPNSRASMQGHVLFLDRVLLFLKISFFFIMLFPLRLITQLANFIPGIRRISLFNTVFTYMSSVQMYQQRQGMKGGTLVDYNQSRRISIQRRFANSVIDMSERGFDRWYIMAHSLGSVIAFKGLMYSDHAFADFVTMDRWHHPKMAYRAKAERRQYHPDAPRRAIWLAEDDVLDSTRIFERCTGLITWGSPLETFARTWPAMVHFKSTAHFRQGFEWINLYDDMDVISSRLASFHAPEAPINPVDFSCNSSSLIFSAHTAYFRPRKGNVKTSPASAVVKWMLSDSSSFSDICKDHRVQEVRRSSAAARQVLKVSQFFIAMLIGLSMWPISVAAFARILFFLPEEIIRFLGIAVRQDDPGNYDSPNVFERMELVYRNSSNTVINRISDLQPTFDLGDDLRKVIIILTIILSLVLFGGVMHNLYDRYTKRRAEDKELIGSKEMALAEVVPSAKSETTSSNR